MKGKLISIVKGLTPILKWREKLKGQEDLFSYQRNKKIKASQISDLMNTKIVDHIRKKKLN